MQSGTTQFGMALTVKHPSHIAISARAQTSPHVWQVSQTLSLNSSVDEDDLQESLSCQVRLADMVFTNPKKGDNDGLCVRALFFEVV